MVLGKSLIDKDGSAHDMLGLLGLVTSFENEKFTWVTVKQLLYTTQNYLVEILRGEAMNFIIARYYLNQMTYCFPLLMLQIMQYKKQVLFEAM